MASQSSSCLIEQWLLGGGVLQNINYKMEEKEYRVHKYILGGGEIKIYIIYN